MRAAVFISPHGFGHAGRAAAVLEALARKREMAFELVTTVPRVFFESFLDVPHRIHPLECDVGLRQSSALDIDLEGTVEALDEFRARMDGRRPGQGSLVDDAAGILEETGSSVALCDISPLGIAGAERAGVPSVLVENFTWDWIYQPFQEEAPGLEPHREWLRRIYERADLRLQPAPVARPHPRALPAPPVARPPRKSRTEVREELGIGLGEPVVLVTMGGLGQDLPFLTRLEDAGATFLVTGTREGGRRGNLVRFRQGDLVYLPDLIAASDLVVGKLGYSTVAEVWLQDRPFLYVANDRFREIGVLRSFVDRELEAEEMSREAFTSGRWLEGLEERLAGSSSGSPGGASDRAGEGHRSPGPRRGALARLHRAPRAPERRPRGGGPRPRHGERLMSAFQLQSPHEPRGDQPGAIAELSQGLDRGDRFQVLLGATGTGKTFTMAHVIANHGRPALVMTHNKTLAAQLYGELKSLFPANAVEYFISYYDYYQPEAYVPATDTYIEKDASINEDIERLRLRATSALMEREDVVIVASVSSIYGLGNPRDYRDLMLHLRVGEEMGRREILRGLVNIQYKRNDYVFERGTFRVRGDTVEIYPAYEEQGIRVELWGDEVDRITRFDPLTGEIITEMDRSAIYPASHYVTRRSTIEAMVPEIREELAEQVARFRTEDRLLEAQRLEQRTNFDIEMMLELGTCPGIENYSRYTSGRNPGERPACLLDYFPDDFLLIVDESHVSIPQISGMYRGDRSRKMVLVEHGFRLPSALDNRPLTSEEWEGMIHQAVFVSATPGQWELKKAGGVVVEQIIRPTGLVDPRLEVRPVKGQVDDLLAEVREREERGERVLVTTLTKRMAEDLAEYLASVGVRVRYMHSEIDAIERMDILRALRLGRIDVLVGINLLREGLDLPEVSLVAILDADKEGFLRDARSLIQTIGRAARNVNGQALMYADRITESMAACIDETNRRREIQLAFNAEHGITPETIRKSVSEIEFSTRVADARERPVAQVKEVSPSYADEVNREEYVKILEEEMRKAAEDLDFERAALLRDQLFEVKAQDDQKKGRGSRSRRSLAQELREAAEGGS